MGSSGSYRANVYLQIPSSKKEKNTLEEIEYLKSKGINNIRVIKRLINALNDFEFIAPKLKDNQDIEEEIVSSIITLAVVNAKYNDFDLHNTIEYVREKRFGDKKSNFLENKEIENILFLLGVNNDYFFTNDLLENINYYIKNSIINKENPHSIF